MLNKLNALDASSCILQRQALPNKPTAKHNQTFFLIQTYFESMRKTNLVYIIQRLVKTVKNREIKLK